MGYKINVLPAAQKQIMAFTREDQIRISRTIDSLAETPRPNGCKKLKGTELWRVRNGHIRVIYAIYDQVLRIVILKAAKRQENTYRHLS